MSSERIVIVDKNDQIIGHKERDTLDKSDIYRVSALWIQNSQGEILLAQRSFNKKNDPGKWGPAVAGTVSMGESYESNIIREAEEEIGVKDQSFQKSFHYFHDGEHKHFTQWFFAVLDKSVDDFKIQEEEIEQIKWFTKDDLLQNIKSTPEAYLDVIPKCINFFCE